LKRKQTVTTIWGSRKSKNPVARRNCGPQEITNVYTSLYGKYVYWGRGERRLEVWAIRRLDWDVY